MGIKGKNDKMVVLACEECKERNYTTTKNKKTNKDRMEMKKHCPRCNKHTVHKETKQRILRDVAASANVLCEQVVETCEPAIIQDK